MIKNKIRQTRFKSIVRINNSIKDEDAKKIIINIAKKSRALNLKKGIRLMNASAIAGLNGTDFIEDKYSVIISFDCFKVPRIVSHYLLRKTAS
jgi:hypothetical protein